MDVEIHIQHTEKVQPCAFSVIIQTLATVYFGKYRVHCYIHNLTQHFDHLFREQWHKGLSFTLTNIYLWGINKGLWESHKLCQVIHHVVLFVNCFKKCTYCFANVKDDTHTCANHKIKDHLIALNKLLNIICQTQHFFTSGLCHFKCLFKDFVTFELLIDIMW